jgi:hypothetical protein
MRCRHFLAVLLLVSCQSPPPKQPANRIEIGTSGPMSPSKWASVDRSGNGTFKTSDTDGWREVKGRFRLTDVQYRALESRLAEFREKAVPTNAKNTEAVLNWRCPKGLPYIFDAGQGFVRWVGPGFDEFYLVHFGCDTERNKSSSERLVSVLDSLPIPAG